VRDARRGIGPRRALSQAAAESELQKPCQGKFLRENNLLGFAAAAAGRAEKAIIYGPPGKNFRPDGSRQASVNHCDLASTRTVPQP